MTASKKQSKKEDSEVKKPKTEKKSNEKPKKSQKKAEKINKKLSKDKKPSTPKKELKKRGPVGHEPTYLSRSQVEAMAGYGVPYEQIATLQSINITTLRKHYKKELDLGKAKSNLKMGQTIYNKATKGDTTAMIWWSKCQMGWKDTSKPEPVVANDQDKQEKLAAALKYLADNLPN